jgi:hypothetical protein
MLFSWAEAAAHCLPQPEGLHKTIDALRKHSGKELRERKRALTWFRSPTVWIGSRTMRRARTSQKIAAACRLV